VVTNKKENGNMRWMHWRKRECG